MTTVLLLCAGFGARMGEMTRSVPKPLLPIAGRPLLDHLLDRLTGLAELGEIHLVTNRGSRRRFERWAGERAPGGPELRLWHNGCARAEERPGRDREQDQRIQPPIEALSTGCKQAVEAGYSSSSGSVAVGWRSPQNRQGRVGSTGSVAIGPAVT